MYPDDRAGMYLIIPLVFIAIFFADEWSQFVTRWWGLDQRHHSRQCSKFRFQSQKDLRGDQPEKWRGIRMPGASQKPIWMERSQPNIPLFHRKTRYKKTQPRFELIFAGYLVCKLCSRMYCCTVSWYVAEIVFSIQWHFKSQWEGAEKIGWNVKGTLFFSLASKALFGTPNCISNVYAGKKAALQRAE